MTASPSLNFRKWNLDDPMTSESCSALAPLKMGSCINVSYMLSMSVGGLRCGEIVSHSCFKTANLRIKRLTYLNLA